MTIRHGRAPAGAPPVGSGICTHAAVQQATNHAGPLLDLAIQQFLWVHRRVETCELVDDRTARRRVSLDFTISQSEADPAGLPDPVHAVPLAMLAKAPLRNFDIYDEDGTPIPVFTTGQAQKVATAGLTAAARNAFALADDVPPERDLGEVVLRDLERIVTCDADDDETLREIRRAQEVVRPADAELPDPTDPEKVRAQRELERAIFERNRVMGNPAAAGLIESLQSNFLLLAQTSVAIGERRILKFTFEEPINARQEGSPPSSARQLASWRARAWAAVRAEARWLGVRLGWLAETVSLSCPTAQWSRSFHIEMAAPAGLEITEARLYSGTASLSDRVSGPLNRVHLHLRDSAAPVAERTTQTEPYAVVYLRAQRSGFLLPAFLASLVTPVLLFFGSLRLPDLAREVEAAATLLLLGPGLLAVYLARPAEHALASRLLSGVRLLLLLSGLCAVAAGCVLIAGFAAEDRLIAWNTLTIMSAAIAMMVGVATLLPTCRSSP